MIECIEGKLIDLNGQKATLFAFGIGYGIWIPLTTFDKICHRLGETVLLYTSQIFREDSNRLFGFLEKEEKKLFETLHPHIGPKTTLSLLGHLSKEVLKRAIELKEVQTLIKVPGIGKKSAERIIVELNGKLDPYSQENSLLEDGVQALVNIGYSAVEARKKILKAQDSVLEKTDLQELLKVALQTKIC